MVWKQNTKESALNTYDCSETEYGGIKQEVKISENFKGILKEDRGRDHLFLRTKHCRQQWAKFPLSERFPPVINVMNPLAKMRRHSVGVTATTLGLDMLFGRVGRVLGLKQSARRVSGRLAKPTRQPKDHPAQPGYWAGLGHLGMTCGLDWVFLGWSSWVLSVSIELDWYRWVVQIEIWPSQITTLCNKCNIIIIYCALSSL